MTKKEAIKVFEQRNIRSLWDDDAETWYFSIVDVVAALTDSPNPQVYWRVLKKRLKDEGNQTVTNCNAFKMRAADGKMRKTDCADIIYKTWADKTAKEYKNFKGLKKENLRDNMTNKELVLNMLAELSAKEISEATGPDTLQKHKQVARRGGEVARNARLELEAKTGKKVVSPLNSKDGILLSTPGNSQEDNNE